MDLEPLNVLVADADDGFAQRAARRLGELGLAACRFERARNRDDLLRASLRADLDLVLLAERDPAGDDALDGLRRALALRWRGPLAAFLREEDGGGGSEERLGRLATCALERRRLGALLDHEALRYRAVFEHAGNATLLLSGAGRVVQANPASARLFAREPEDLLGQPFAALFAAGDAAAAAEVLERALQGAGAPPPEAELRLAAAGPAEVAAHLLVAPVFDELGRPLFCVLQLADISARRRAEQEARRKQRVFEAILRVQAQYIRAAEPRPVFAEILERLLKLTDSPQGFVAEIVEEREDGAGTLVVRAASRPRDASPQEPDGDAFEGVELRDGEGLVQRAVAACEPLIAQDVLLDPRLGGFPATHAPLSAYVALPLLRGRRCLGLVALANAPDGYRREQIDELRPLLATAAGVLENLWHARRRAATERELQDSQRALATLMGHLPGMAYRCHDDDRRTLEFASEGCLELTGWNAGALVERREREFADLVHPEDRERVARTVGWALLERQRFELTWRLVRADGSERTVWEQGRGVFSHGGELEFVEGLLTDVTEKLRAQDERRRLEARVLHAQKLESLGLLAGGIAHDLNNLLLGILGHASLARRHQGAADRVAGALTAIEAAAARAAELADHMLAYTGRGALSPRPLDLSALVAKERATLARLLGGSCALELELARDLPLVSSDPARVHELLAHTLRNAAEAAGPAGGRVTVRTRAVTLTADELVASFAGAPLDAGAFVELEIEDDGAGMSAETLTRACDPFFTTKEAGRGLGLSSVLGGVRAHGGALAIDSAPGRGTRVRLVFPVLGGTAPARATPAVAASSSAKPPALRPRRTHARPARRVAKRPGGTVLVVDDESLVRDLARALLEDAGYDVLCAEDGERGVALYREHASAIAAVLLDLTMPRLDGEGALAEIRRLHPDARVLLTSGYAEHDAMHRIASRAGVDFLQKPWRLDDLLSKLGALIAGS